MKTNLAAVMVSGVCLCGALLGGVAVGQDWLPVAVLNGNAATDTGGDDLMQMAAGSDGVWIAVWQSNDTLGGTIGTDYDILFARSTDHGKTWSAPAALNSNAGSDSGHDEQPRLATDGKGNWVAVWASEENLGGIVGTDYDLLAVYSTDNGITWSAPAVLNSDAATDSGSDRYSRVATDGEGNWIAVWSSTDTFGGTIGTDFDVIYAKSTNNGADWSAAAVLNSDAATDSLHDWNPSISADGTGSWVVAWQTEDPLFTLDPDIFYARSTDDGDTWSAPAVLNSDADGETDYCPELTTDGAGHWVVAWHSTSPYGDDTDILYVRSSDNGATWSEPAPLNSNATTDSGSDQGPLLATDRAGTWIAVWTSTEDLAGVVDTDFDIFYATSLDNGATWTDPAVINSYATTDNSFDYAQCLATDCEGVWIATWYSNDSQGGTIGTDNDLLYSRRVVTWPVTFATDGTPGATVNGAAMFTQTVANGEDCTPVTANAPAGYVFVGWTGDYVGLDNPLTVTSVTAAMAITANFVSAAEAIYLTMATSGNGTVNPAGMVTVRQGVPVDIAATPDAGNQFIRWSVLGEGAVADERAATTTVTLAGDAAAIAIFATDADTVAMTVLAGADGAVSPAGTTTLIKGQAQAIAATPDTGHHFTGWAGTVGAAVANTATAATTVSLSQDATVTASFAINTYTVTFDLDGKGTRTGGGELVQAVEHGAAATAPTVAGGAGWTFMGWDADFDDVTADLTVTALYQADQVTCGSVFTVDAALVEGLTVDGLFLFKPKVYATYTNPVTGKSGQVAVKVLTKVSVTTPPPTLACEWTKKIRLYDAKAFKASEAGGIGAADWITEANQHDLVMNLRLASKEVEDQFVQPLALAVPVIANIADGTQDAKGNDLLVITGTWFGTKKPKVWREYEVDDGAGGVIVKQQTMKVVKPTDLSFVDSKGKPAYMDAGTGASKVIVVVPAGPKGALNGAIVLGNGVGMATGTLP